MKDPVEGTTATAHVSYFLSDAAFIFPITPSSPMAEQAHAWSMNGRLNAFGVPTMVRQMQSEGGSAGALHGAIAEGALATTFTSSQGLLLMIPNMYKIAGELTPCVMNVAARTIATEALSIFGDHSDIYAARSTGFSFLCASSVQECAHMAAVASLATLRSTVPFVHFFDGFRTSHEVSKIELPSDEQLMNFLDQEALKKFRLRGLNPQHPVLRGTAQNPDVFFQAQEALMPSYKRVPQYVEEALAVAEKVFGTKYGLFEYFGHPEAENVVVCMGSAVEIVKSTIDCVNAKGGRFGVVNVRLFRPFSLEHFFRVLPKTAKRICVLDRGKDPQAVTNPLHADVCQALIEAGKLLPVIGGLYGLSSKDFNPDHVLAVLKNMTAPTPKNHFTVGIIDDVSGSSLDVTEHIDVLPAGTRQCLLWGIGGDGTVGANKTAIKLIADHTELHAQGYFAYDANKAGGLTVSHLRFGPTRFEAPFLVNDSDYVACHNTSYIHRFKLLESLRVGGNFVLNCPWTTVAELEKHLPAQLLRDIATKKAVFYVVDANKIARESGMGPFINMPLQAVFFKLSNVLEVNEAIGLLKNSIKKMYHKKGEAVIAQNIKAVDMSLDPAALVKVEYPASWASVEVGPAKPKEGVLALSDKLAEFNREVFAPVARYEGDAVPVSKMPLGGELPTGTSQLSKRGIAEKVPHWNSTKCVQCNQCSFVCPHAVIRSYQINESELKEAPENFATLKSRKPEHHFRINVSALDCTGCSVCAEQCPVKCLEMVPIEQEYEQTKDAIRFVRDKVRPKPELGDKKSVVGLGSQPPLLEFPGSCAGCGETPLVRLLTQIFGDRMVIAAATGCNSIWGGSFPLVPYTTNGRGEGPAWQNSLFEDAAELGYGMVSAYRQRRSVVLQRVEKLLAETGAVKGFTAEIKGLLEAWVRDFKDYEKTREIRDKLMPLMQALPADADCRLKDLAEAHNFELIARTSFWILGGDGWAYDIGYGGLDHVVANLEDINILVLDTEVYSNTGGQRSKATPLGAQAKFAVSGKETPKKDLGRMVMSYENCYVASIAQGADMQQCINALREAESYDGPSLVIAYTPCMEHQLVRGMRDSMKVQKLAVDTGYWLLYRFNPALADQGKNPLTLDSKAPSKHPKEFLSTQGRFVALQRESPAHAQALQDHLAESLALRYQRYTRMVNMFEPLALPAQPQAAPAPKEEAKPVAAPAPKEEAKPAPAPAAAAPAAAKRLLVLFATETGNSEAAAKHIQAEARKMGLTCDVVVADSFNFASNLAKEDAFVVCCSTFADDMPANGAKFWAWLSGKPKLEGSFALFGLGDSGYPIFQQIPKKVHEALLATGAKEFFARGEGDESNGGFMKSLEKWAPEMLKEAAKLVQCGKTETVCCVKGVCTPVAPAKEAAPVVIPAATCAFDEVKAVARAEELVRAGKAVKVAGNIYWVGAVDYAVRDFHGIQVNRGTSYNAYLILGPNPTLVDTVKGNFAPALLASLRSILGDLSYLKYVVVNHAESDHAGAMPAVMTACPGATVVCTPKCKDALLKQFCKTQLDVTTGQFNLTAIEGLNGHAEAWTYKLVNNTETLSLGKNQTLWFFETPMVHWPESTMTYYVEERVLFTSDAFGQHVASKARFVDELSAQDLALVYEEAKSYFANILMLYGKVILRALDRLVEQLPAVDKQFNPSLDASKEASPALPRIFATAHGFSWRTHLTDIVGLYKRWSAHVTQKKVLVLYDTMYGSTERMAHSIMQGAADYRAPNGEAADVELLSVRENHVTDSADQVIDASCIALGTPCLNGDILPTVAKHVAYLRGLRPEKRHGLAFGSFGWATAHAQAIGKLLESLNVAPVCDPIACQFVPTDAVLAQCYEAGQKLAKLAIENGKPY